MDKNKTGIDHHWQSHLLCIGERCAQITVFDAQVLLKKFYASSSVSSSTEYVPQTASQGALSSAVRNTLVCLATAENNKYGNFCPLSCAVKEQTADLIRFSFVRHGFFRQTGNKARRSIIISTITVSTIMPAIIYPLFLLFILFPSFLFMML